MMIATRSDRVNASSLASSVSLGPGAQIAFLPDEHHSPAYHPPGVLARASVVLIRAGTQPTLLGSQ